MAVDVGTIIGDTILAAGPVGASVVAAVFARRAINAGRHNAAKLADQDDTLARQDVTLARIEQNTDARQTERIKQAVEQVAREHPGLFAQSVYTEALRDLLDAFIGASLTDDEYEAAHERRAKITRPARHDGESR